MAKKKVNQLKFVKWDEVSGVDDPANLQRGWLALKQRLPGKKHNSDMLQLVKALRRVEDDIPDDISAAYDVVKQYAELITANSNSKNGVTYVLDLDDRDTRRQLLNLMADEIAMERQNIIDSDYEFEELTTLAKAVRLDLDIIQGYADSNTHIAGYVNDWLTEQRLPLTLPEDESTDFYADEVPDDYVLGFIRKASSRLNGRNRYAR